MVDSWNLPGLLYSSPVAMLAASVKAVPDRIALVSGPLRLSYAEYGRAVAGLTRELLAKGVTGRVVVVSLRNGVEIAIALFAIQAAGATACPINPDYTPRELAELLADASPALIIAKMAEAERVRTALADGDLPDMLVLPENSDAWVAVWREDNTLELTDTVPDPDGVAALQYTGGTTGRPKGVELTHRQIAVNIAQREAFLPMHDGERVLCMMPLFHVFAISMCLHLAAYCRGTLVILPRYRPDWVVDTIEQERITILPAGPTVFNGLLSYQGSRKERFASLRACYSGSAALSVDTLTQWQSLAGCPVYEGYGQTEAGPILTYNAVFFPSRPGSVGRPVPATTIQVVDLETGTTVLPVEESGEIRARGPQIMRGYRGRPNATAETLRDGWLYTGDIGVIDRDGVLTIQGRKKDMVITGGFNVYPREIDEVMSGHPAVAEAATIGVPDAYRGEVLHAYVQLVPGAILDAEALLAWAAERLVRYKVPSAIHIMPALPRTSVAKVDKLALQRANYLQSQ